MGPKYLNIYDFDGTLFNSPLDTPENRKKYEKATGEPWLIDKETSRELSKKLDRFVPIRRGWWGRAETLEPPLVPKPAPREWYNEETIASFFASKKDKETKTVIMTGRHRGLQHQVFRILDERNLVGFHKKRDKEGKVYYTVDDPCVDCYFLGDNPPKLYPHWLDKPSETYAWKVWIINHLLDYYESIRSLKIWEDRQEHVEKFGEYIAATIENGCLNSGEVIHVKNES